MSYKKITLLTILIILLLTACGGLGSGDEARSMASEPAAAQMDGAIAETAGDMDRVDVEKTTEESAAFFGEGGEIASANQPAAQERLIIRTANLSLIVTDPEESLKTITQMAEQNGGWVVNSNIYQFNADAKSADITIRVPATGFNSAMEALKASAVEVQHENISGQDVTEEYVDLEARLENLESTAARVRAFLDEAETVEEALAVNQELSRLEGEIEQLKGRMQYLSQSAAFSTIAVNLTPDIAAQPPQVESWRPEGVAKNAVEALVNTLQALGSLAIWLVILILPLALMIGIPFWLIIRFGRRRWQHRQDNSEAASTTD